MSPGAAFELKASVVSGQLRHAEVCLTLPPFTREQASSTCMCLPHQHSAGSMGCSAGLSINLCMNQLWVPLGCKEAAVCCWQRARGRKGDFSSRVSAESRRKQQQ